MIELLVVIAIIATLSSVLLLVINPAEMGRKSRDSKRLSDLATIKRAVDLALADKQNLSDIGMTTINTTTPVTNFAGMGGFNIGKYTPFVPQDPVYDAGSAESVLVLTYSGGVCERVPVSKNNMGYIFWSDGETYVLQTRMESMASCDTIIEDGNPDDYFQLGTDPGLDMISEVE